MTDFSDQNTRAAAFVGFEFLDELLHADDCVGHIPDLPLVNACDRADFRAVTAIDFFECA